MKEFVGVRSVCLGWNRGPRLKVSVAIASTALPDLTTLGSTGES